MIAMRDQLAHRGPDGAGLWRHENAILAHRRLAVRHLGDEALQPMLSNCGLRALVYNGELYNDEELRREILTFDRRPFRTQCDTETVFRALELWGERAIERFRGMFALAWWDSPRKRLTLARDPLGIKPLYFGHVAGEFVYASEPTAILAHPQWSAQPNLAMVSAYLTTIRTVIGADTLFEGIFAVEPGQIISIDSAGDELQLSSRSFWSAPESSESDCSDELVRRAIESSVESHLCADVPVCALLSGGLDSTITTSIAHQHIQQLRTYCAGARTDGEDTDLACARTIAEELKVSHDQAVLTQDYFCEHWPAMIHALGVPLSTPNEVAIHAVAARLRADGCIVTISGEGADEFFAGYDAPMLAAWQFSRMDESRSIGGRFQLESNAWAPSRAKSILFHSNVWSAVEQDAHLGAVYDNIFATCEQEAGPFADPAEAHLRFLQKVNLAGLLQRLDTATMLAGVEGRTPLADVRVAELACALPMNRKFIPDDQSSDAGGGVAVHAGVQAKIALRSAFAGRIPELALHRPKASFPLPFQSWIAEMAPQLRDSPLAQALFTTDAIETVAAAPTEQWRLAWPMINIALWGDRWWG